MPPGCETLTPAEAEQVERIAAAVVEDESASRLLKACPIREYPIIWPDPETGLVCKARLDAFSDGGVILDLKTAENASEGAFTREAYKYLYTLQSAFYVHGAQVLSGRKDWKFVFIVVEKAPPFGVHVFHADSTFLADGEILRRDLLARVAECEAAGVWPSYGEDLLLGKGAV